MLTAHVRGETVHQVLDRNLTDLLQELRVAITGVQILFAFLLGLAFTARFATLGGFEITVYTVALVSTALATIVLIAPVSFHRLVFRRRQRATLVAVADRLLLVGLGLLALALSSATLLVLDVVLGRWQGLVGGGVIALTGALTWYVLPVSVRRTAERAADPEDPPDEETDPPFGGCRRGHPPSHLRPRGPAVTDPQRTPHPREPAEGDTAPGREVDDRTPRTPEPAEGKDLPVEGADTPDT